MIVTEPSGLAVTSGADGGVTSPAVAVPTGDLLPASSVVVVVTGVLSFTLSSGIVTTPVSGLTVTSVFGVLHLPVSGSLVTVTVSSVPSGLVNLISVSVESSFGVIVTEPSGLAVTSGADGGVTSPAVAVPTGDLLPASSSLPVPIGCIGVAKLEGLLSRFLLSPYTFDSLPPCAK
ncbi:hypothetical protein LMG8286_01254 [Campylobacter suis]|uniref:Uncharacterized protein n=1 Tax=Campylobacter suis TaxID=2790657 RepID=A0ABM8Q633_9BACT|nr:hypothetical protein LMG8286_01254 [Campylobacter suis]